MSTNRNRLAALVAILATVALTGFGELRGTGDLGLVVERADGGLLVVDTTARATIGRIEGLGDLSHASVVYTRDARYGFVFGRDGALTKVDVLTGEIVARVHQAGNSIGGAISQDGSLVAVANYEPGGIRVFDAVTLAPVAEVAADIGNGERSKVVGLVDAPGPRRFVFSLYEGDQIWIADIGSRGEVEVTRIEDVGRQPYDALLTPDGRYYIAGLFGEDGLALVDLWHPERGARRILPGYGRGEQPLPVYKMPHLEGWALAGDLVFLPAVGRHEVLVVSSRDWREVGRVPVHGQPVFVMARPDGRKVWVSHAHPRNDTLQVIDVETLTVERAIVPGKAVLHMEFTPRGEHVWVSVRDDDRVDVYDTRTYERIETIPARKPSGIFFTARAHVTGL